MRTRGWAVAALVTWLSCFNTARYDRAHTRRVASIQAKYDARLKREQDHHNALVADLDRRRRQTIAVKVDEGHAPASPVAGRVDIVECNRLCATQRTRCAHDICQPAYVDALIKTYYRADFAWVTSQLAISTNTDLESLLAFSHNQSLVTELDRQAVVLAQRHADARNRLEHQREREIRASLQLRDAEIAARRERVKAFSAEDRARPSSRPIGAEDPLREDMRGCEKDRSCAPSPSTSPVHCIPDAPDAATPASDPASQAADQAGRATDSSTQATLEPRTTIGCRGEQDCPAGMVCDVAAGVCCATALR